MKNFIVAKPRTIHLWLVPELLHSVYEVLLGPWRRYIVSSIYFRESQGGEEFLYARFVADIQYSGQLG